MENILVTIENNIATITINRPTKLNALNKSTIEELHNALTAIATNGEVKAVLITGSGEKAFVAGADIAEFSAFTSHEGASLAAEGQRLLFDFIENFNKPVVAAINGFALGGGLELAMACHFRVASENAKMGLPETSLGLIPGYGGTQRLPQLVGKGRAMEMIMTASMIDAQTAKEIGLVNHVVEQKDLIDFTLKIIEKILRNSPSAIAFAIKAINANFASKTNGYEVEIDFFGACFDTPNFREGTQAFLEKRKPKFW